MVEQNTCARVRRVSSLLSSPGLNWPPIHQPSRSMQDRRVLRCALRIRSVPAWVYSAHSICCRKPTLVHRHSQWVTGHWHASFGHSAMNASNDWSQVSLTISAAKVGMLIDDMIAPFLSPSCVFPFGISAQRAFSASTRMTTLLITSRPPRRRPSSTSLPPLKWSGQ